MKTIFLASLTFALASPAFALSHYDGRRSTCRSLQEALVREGQIVVITGDQLYFRTVAEPSMCLRDEKKDPKYTKTKDVERCHVGYECKM